jgi:hypothetical protein
VKVVPDNNVSQLTIEHSRLQQHAKICGCSLLAIPTATPIISVNGLSGYALTPVGRTRVTREIAFESQTMLNRVVAALNQLHTHAIGGPIVHGDSRIPNLIMTAAGLDGVGALFWIDLGSSQWNLDDACLPVLCRKDMDTLAQSLLPSFRSNPNVEIFSKLKGCLDVYSEELSIAATENIAAEIFQCYICE